MEGEAQASEASTSEPAQQPAVSSNGRTAEFESANSGSSPETASNETDNQTSDGKPQGFDKVEFTPEQLARVNRIYGNMKRYESGFREQEELNRNLVAEITRIQSDQQKIVSHLQTTDFSDAEVRLKSERDSAWGKGDVNAFNDANDKLNEIRVEKKLIEAQRKTQPQPQQQRPSTDGQALLNRARSQGELNASEETAVQSWMGETDANGNLRRPWTSTGDPRNYSAALEAQSVLNNPLYATKPLTEKLKEIDRRMGLQTAQPQTNVLSGGNLTRGKPTSNIKLDPKIEDLAVRMKFAGKDPKLTAQDHIGAWKKAVEKSQAKGSKR